MKMNRRGFLAGLLATAALPAVVKQAYGAPIPVEYGATRVYGVSPVQKMIDATDELARAFEATAAEVDWALQDLVKYWATYRLKPVEFVMSPKFKEQVRGYVDQWTDSQLKRVGFAYNYGGNVSLAMDKLEMARPGTLSMYYGGARGSAMSMATTSLTPLS